MNEISIGSRKIGDGHPPFIIAEMSGNHNQSLDRALEIVRAAAAAGAHAIKLQTYTPDTMTMKGALVIDDPSSLWAGRELYDLYREAYTPWEWHEPIFDLARELGLIPFSSPFDESAVDFLESLGVDLYKIASFENTDIPLLRKVAGTGKPVIMSTGVSTLAEVDEAVRTLRQSGCSELVLLKCTSTYPADPFDSNIRTIPALAGAFGCAAGLSDHTFGIGVAVASVALGACVIEKHFTLRRADGGVDSAFSLEPAELKSLVDESLRAFQGLGQVRFSVNRSEEKSRLFKRSVFVSKAIRAGDVFSRDNLRVIRPGTGLEPRYFDLVLGKRSRLDIDPGTPLTWDHLL